MADSIVTIKSNAKKIAKMAAKDLADAVHAFKTMQKFGDDNFKPDATGHSPGDTVSVRVPPKFTVGTASFDLTSSLQDVKERSVDATLDIIGTVGFDLDTQQLAHDVNLGQVYERFVRPAVMDIAASVENQMIRKATQATYNLVGTAGAGSNDTNTVLSGRTLLN